MSPGQLRYRFELWLGYTPLVELLHDLGTAGYLRWIPPLPGWVKKWNGSEPAIGPKSLEIPPLPEKLKSYPGILRDPKLEAEAFEKAPLPTWPSNHRHAIRLIGGGTWTSTLPFWPSRGRSIYGLVKAPWQARGALPAQMSPEELSAAVKRRAAEIGLSAIGIAPYDRKYTWAEFVNLPDIARIGNRVIACVLEQNWEATQTIPSARGERAAFHDYAKLGPMIHQLATYLRNLGYATHASEGTGRGVSIHYAVESGLGQLGLNGQLLTPFAGSRCRLMLIFTAAPLAIDTPKDFGIPAICDLCKACVRRCPSGAIPSQRQYHRGVNKIKIKTERCIPMMAQAHACGVCMKVCPVQRYGLPAVIEHFDKTGTILGRGTDELEGYHWPGDGRYYGPGEKPKSAVTHEGLHPRGWSYEDDARALAARSAKDGSPFWARWLKPLRDKWIDDSTPDLT